MSVVGAFLRAWREWPEFARFVEDFLGADLYSMEDDSVRQARSRIAYAAGRARLAVAHKRAVRRARRRARGKK